MAPVRIGYANNPLAWRFTHRVPHRWGDGTHEVERHAGLLAPFLNDRVAVAEPKLHPGSRHVAEADAIQARDAVLVMPGSQWATKAWPEGQFARFLAQTDQRVVLMGAPNEHALCARLAEGHGHVTNAAGALSLLGFVAAVGMARAVVVNDSAPLHVASATDACGQRAPCRALVGPRQANTSWWRHPPELPCRPCGMHGRKRCPGELQVRMGAFGAVRAGGA